MSILEIIFVIIICTIFASITYGKGMLDMGGSVTAFFIGIILGLFGGIWWIVLLLIFLASAFLATRYKFQYKRTKGVQEGSKGERGIINVLANGSVPVIIALFHSPTDGSNILGLGFLEHKLAVFLFVTAVACAASDTLASEMGVLSDRAYLITNGKRVTAGTNGGISLLGEMWALFGSFYTFLIAFFVFYFISSISLPYSWIILGIVMGFVSCQFDSVLGAAFERKGLLGKSSVNMTAIASSIMITGVILWLMAY